MRETDRQTQGSLESTHSIYGTDENTLILAKRKKYLQQFLGIMLKIIE